MHAIKKKEFFTARSSNCSGSAMFFPMLVETPYFGGVINSKTYLNNEWGCNFFSLSDSAYELVNLLVFEKCSKLLVWDSTLPMNLKSIIGKAWYLAKSSSILDGGLSRPYEIEWHLPHFSWCPGHCIVLYWTILSQSYFTVVYCTALYTVQPSTVQPSCLPNPININDCKVQKPNVLTQHHKVVYRSSVTQLSQYYCYSFFLSFFIFREG